MSTLEAARRGAATDRPRWAVRFAWAIFAITIAGYLARGWLQWQNGGARSDLEFGQLEGLLFVTFPLVGLVLATKLPRNPLGWMMLAIGFAFLNPGAAYARYASITQQGELPGAGLALALHYPGWVVFIGLAGFLLMLFPDGHLPTPRWRSFAWACGLGLALLYVVESMNPEVGALFDLPRVASPFAVEALGAGGSLSVLVVVTAFAPLSIVAGAVAVIQRAAAGRRRGPTGAAALAGVGRRSEREPLRLEFDLVLLRLVGGLEERSRDRRVQLVRADPGRDRHRRAALPALRHRLRDPQDGRDHGHGGGDRRGVRRIRRRHRRARRLVGQPCALGPGGGGRGDRLPAGQDAREAIRRPPRLWEAGHALRGHGRVR